MKRFSCSLTWGFVCVRKARGRFLVRYVPMREQKTMRKGTFFELGSAQRCYHFIIKGRKNAIFVGKRCVFFLQILQNVAESRE